jgi:hypothetical protein
LPEKSVPHFVPCLVSSEQSVIGNRSSTGVALAVNEGGKSAASDVWTVPTWGESLANERNHEHVDRLDHRGLNPSLPAPRRASQEHGGGVAVDTRALESADARLDAAVQAGRFIAASSLSAGEDQMRAQMQPMHTEFRARTQVVAMSQAEGRTLGQARAQAQAQAQLQQQVPAQRQTQEHSHDAMELQQQMQLQGHQQTLALEQVETLLHIPDVALSTQPQPKSPRNQSQHDRQRYDDQYVPLQNRPFAVHVPYVPPPARNHSQLHNELRDLDHLLQLGSEDMPFGTIQPNSDMIPPLATGVVPALQLNPLRDQQCLFLGQEQPRTQSRVPRHGRTQFEVDQFLRQSYPPDQQLSPPLATPIFDDMQGLKLSGANTFDTSWPW